LRGDRARGGAVVHDGLTPVLRHITTPCCLE
jgi:hypothetical protein